MDDRQLYSEKFSATAITSGHQEFAIDSLISHLHMFTGIKTSKRTGFQKKNWGCKKEPGKFSNPPRDILLLILMNLGFNVFTFSEMLGD